jgi:effector-binding domain-containing protein
MKTNYEPRLEKRAERPYVFIRAQVTLKEWSKANALVGKLFAWLEKKKIAPAGAPFFRYWIIGDENKRFHLEVGVPLERMHRGDGRIQAGTMPKGTYATVIHHGHPDQLHEAYTALEKWGEAQGIKWNTRQEDKTEVWNGRFESFLTNPADQPDPNQGSKEIALLVADDEPETAESDFPKIGKPALRALNYAGYSRLEQLTQVSEQELLSLHGMGPKAMRLLREALAEEGWSFAEAQEE